MKTKLNIMIASTVVLFSAMSMSAHAANRLGASWHDLLPVQHDQVRIVYYRTADTTEKKAANIYVDGEFQTALMSGGFNVFCLSPGEHSLSSFVNDAPGYKGKIEQPWRDKLAAGKTYYIQASLDDSGRPLVQSEADALQSLGHLRKQRGVLSRASTVETCRVSSNTNYDNYAFSSDLLFKFNGSSEKDISGEGRHAVLQFAQMLTRRGEAEQQIIVTGFTDPIGTDENNLALGQRRAETVRKILINNGLSEKNIIAQSMGESQVKLQCEGTLAHRKLCFESERRVIISVKQ